MILSWTIRDKFMLIKKIITIDKKIIILAVIYLGIAEKKELVKCKTEI